MNHITIKGGTVTNITVGQDPSAEAAGAVSIPVLDGQVVGIGYTTTDNVTFTAPTPTYKYTDLTFGEFQDLCWAALGAVASPTETPEVQFIQGGDRFGEIVTAVETDTTTLGKAILQRYTGGISSGFRYDKTEQFLSMLVSAGKMLQAEFDAVIGAWPKVIA